MTTTFEELEQTRINYKQKREKVIRKLLIIFLSIIGLVALIFILPNLFSPDFNLFEAILSLFFFSLQVGFFFFVIGLIVVLLSTNKEEKAYQLAYKSYFVTATLAKVFTDISYSHDAKMPYELISGTRMMNMGDTYNSNDYFVAKYKGIPFQQADVHIQEEHTDSDGDTSYTTIFRGRWVVFDFHKRFEKRLLVEGKHFGCGRISKQDNFQRIELESIEFSKNFSVYAQDGFEAFYLLDPAVMVRIQKLSDLHNGRIMVCFADGKMHIGINNNIDSFEPPAIKNPIDQQKEFDKVMNDIKVITNIVDEIKLIR